MESESGIGVLAAISDMHCGGTTGLWPPGMVITDDTPAPQNGLQRLIWDGWCDFWQAKLPTVVGDREYALLINGDAIDGYHHRTKQVMSVEVGDHVRAAMKCLELGFAMFRQPKRVFVTVGTECHTGEVESSLGERLGAEKPEGSAFAASGRWLINLRGVTTEAMHHMSCTSIPRLESGALGREMGDAIQSYAMQGLEAPRVFLRAHRHVYGEFRSMGRLLVVTPAWQAGTRYVDKVVRQARTEFGGVVLDYDDKMVDGTPRSHALIDRATTTRKVVSI